MQLLACILSSPRAACLLASHGCSLQLEATIAQFPNMLPYTYAVLQGQAASLTRQSVGTSSSAAHLRGASAPENMTRGFVMPCGILNLQTMGNAARLQVEGADPRDIISAKEIFADHLTGHATLEIRRGYIQRHENMLTRGCEGDDAYILLIRRLTDDCKLVRVLRESGYGSWYIVPNFAVHTKQNLHNDLDGIRINLRYICDDVRATKTRAGNSVGFTKEQVEDWRTQEERRRAEGVAVQSVPTPPRRNVSTNGNKPPVQCELCNGTFAYAHIARHRRSCANAIAAGRVLSTGTAMAASDLSDTLQRERGH
jgi:hypothetical protein